MEGGVTTDCTVDVRQSSAVNRSRNFIKAVGKVFPFPDGCFINC